MWNKYYLFIIYIYERTEAQKNEEVEPKVLSKEAEELELNL